MIKLHFFVKTSFLLTLLGFFFSHEVIAQSDWDYNLRDVNGTLLISNNVKRYRDTLVFQHPQTGILLKIPVKNIMNINGYHPDSSGLRNLPYPTEVEALIRLRNGQLVSFWTGIITACLTVVIPDAVIPIILTGGVVSGIGFFRSYGGIRKMKKYQKIPVVLKF